MLEILLVASFQSIRFSSQAYTNTGHYVVSIEINNNKYLWGLYPVDYNQFTNTIVRTVFHQTPYVALVHLLGLAIEIMRK